MNALIKRSMFLGAVLISLTIFSQSVVAQTSLSGNLTVDNQFVAYISTNADNTAPSTQIGADLVWQTVSAITPTVLTAGATNYLHIVGTDIGPPAMFLGEFALDNALFQFADGSQNLLTDLTNWTASTAGFGGAPATLESFGTNGAPTAPWGNFALIDDNAEFIWAVGEGTPPTVYFTAAITPVTVDINIQSTENSDDPVVAGSGPGNMSFTFTVTNDGANDATGVVADFTVNVTGFPVGVCIPQVDTGTFTNLTWDIGDLAGGSTATATFDLDCEIYAASEHNSTYEIILDLTSVDQVDTDDTNNSSSQMATIIRLATFDITKIWDGGEVEVTLTCDGVAVSTGFTSGLMASFTYGGFADGEDCSVTETVPSGYSPTYSADCNVTGVLSGSTYACDITNDVSLARFNVTKIFSDGSVNDVVVAITCDDGLPLHETATISSDDPTGVNFVVKSFIDGAMNCEIAEIGSTPGYEPATGCSYSNVTAGDYDCELTNAAEDATFTVYMEWIIPTEGGVEIDEDVDVTITCISFDSTVEVTKATLGDGESLQVTVDTTLGSATCGAVQDSLPSGVEPSSVGCGPRTVSAGDSLSCTFTNTVFFEGIPTLSQYGLALLALLMLGVGMVGFRRFA
jgi:hypothetical protein